MWDLTQYFCVTKQNNYTLPFQLYWWAIANIIRNNINAVEYLVISSWHSKDVASQRPASVPNYIIKLSNFFRCPAIAWSCISPNDDSTILITEGKAKLYQGGAEMANITCAHSVPVIASSQFMKTGQSCAGCTHHFAKSHPLKCFLGSFRFPCPL